LLLIINNPVGKIINTLGNKANQIYEEKDKNFINEIHEKEDDSCHMTETEVRSMLNNYNNFIVELSNKNLYFEKRSKE
jgi:hypothetical protein